MSRRPQHFFDNDLLPCLRETVGRPYAIVHGASDDGGAFDREGRHRSAVKSAARAGLEVTGAVRQPATRHIRPRGDIRGHGPGLGRRNLEHHGRLTAPGVLQAATSKAPASAVAVAGTVRRRARQKLHERLPATNPRVCIVPCGFRNSAPLDLHPRQWRRAAAGRRKVGPLTRQPDCPHCPGLARAVSAGERRSPHQCPGSSDAGQVGPGRQPIRR